VLCDLCGEIIIRHRIYEIVYLARYRFGFLKNLSAGANEMMPIRRHWSSMYLASRLRRWRRTILNLSEKVNHISTSAFDSPIDSVVRYAL
jgi:hypothetical protein